MKQLNDLLTHINEKFPELNPEVLEAFKQTPRHLFIKKDYSMEEMYQDYPLTLFVNDDFVSTISQPSFVLLMINLLKLEPKHKVLEVGAGSGWNAALMSRLCSSVVAIEIIPELARETKNNLKDLNLDRVLIIEGDAALGYEPAGPYDRVIFTAGATDLPKALYEQTKMGGKLLFVLKTSDVDLLLLMEKKSDGFYEEKRIHCSFVPMKGSHEAKASTEFDHLVHSEKIKISPSDENQGRDSVFSAV